MSTSKYFQSYKERIELGIKNNMPHDAKAMWYGVLTAALNHDLLTVDEVFKLEDLLGDRAPFQNALDFVMLGNDWENFDKDDTE